ncbi:MAG: DegT/DnrJ/EryC1/StrS family aminotransferase [candidate division WOR-3 bacterium]|nr:DegT/DnrJ/EryC1/StrS family aminotransferase [candidate division WOR-3 bacterium]
MQVPFMDLKRQYEMIKDEIDEAIKKTIESCAFVAGEMVKEFEKNFASYCGTKYGIAISSGTSAIYAALKALDIGRHDAVITVPYTFIATAEAISFTGATPIFVDIKEDSYTIDPEKVKEYIENKCEWIEKKGILRDRERKLNVRAIIPVHLYGQTADMDEILKIAQEYNLAVIEDAAQAHGALYKNKKAGSIGLLSAFSFYPSKNLGAYGQGGMVLTNDEGLAEKVRMLIDHGQKERYLHEFEGWNFKMDGFQAAILNVKLNYLDDWNEDRRQNAYYYNQLLNNTEKIITPKEMDYGKHIYHLYAVRVPDREKFQNFLKERGIGTGIHYPKPLHLQKAYNHLGYKEGDFPISEKCAREIVSLPMFPELTKKEIEYVCEQIKDWAVQS